MAIPALSRLSLENHSKFKANLSYLRSPVSKVATEKENTPEEGHQFLS